MLDINLLPPEYAPRKLVYVSNLIILGIAFFIGLSLFLSSLKLLAEARDYSERVAYHDIQIERYRQQAEDIGELRQKVKLLRSRLSLVEELLRENAMWSDKLVELTQRIPRNGVWINGLSIGRSGARSGGRRGAAGSPGSGPIVVNITGTVVSVDKMSQFVANLEESETYGDVVFENASSDPKKDGGESLISFTLTVQILAPGERRS